MELDVNDILQRYSTALAEETQKRILAEAKAAALQAKVDEMNGNDA